MFSHVMVGTNDLEASRKFYDASLGALGIAPGKSNRDIRYFYRSPSGVFAVTLPIDQNEATFANGGTIGLSLSLLSKSMLFMLRVLQMAGSAVKTLQAIARDQAGKCILRICVIQLAIRSAQCLGSVSVNIKLLRCAI